MELLLELGFTKQDLLLIVLCPIFSTLGGFVHFVILDTNFEKLPMTGGIQSVKGFTGRMHWMLGRLIISGVLGLLFSLYFVGTVSDGAVAIAKLLAFSILLGYAAPKFWLTQENVVTPALEKKLEDAINKYINK